MKVEDLIGAELDLWVARAAGVDAVLSDAYADGSRDAVTFYCRDHDGILDGRCYKPSSNWADGGPIIERERMAIAPITRNRSHTAQWQAQVWIPFAVQTGATPLIAAMRAFVAGKFGDEVSDSIAR